MSERSFEDHSPQGADGHELSRLREENERLAKELSETQWRAAAAEAAVAELKRVEQERDRLRAEVGERAAELQATIASLADGVVIYDAAGNRRYGNAAADRILRLSPEEQGAASLLDFTSIVPMSTPEGEPINVKRTPIFRALRGEATQGYVIVFRRPAGDIWISCSAAPICSADGRMLGAVASFTDVTALHEAGEELRSRQAAFDAFFEASPGVLNLFDQDLRFINSDPITPTYFGLDHQSILGRSMWELNLPFARDFLGPLARRVIESRRPEHVEVQGLIPDRAGEAGYFRASYFPVPLGKGKTGLGSIALEITDLKRAEDSLREADRLKDEFLAMLSHELRNPLAAITTASEVLAEESNHWAAEIARRQAGHMARLLDDLLDVSRITRGKITLRKQRIGLHGAIQNALEVVRPRIDEAGHHLHVSLPHEDLFVDGDPVRIVQVITNLLSNSAKYTLRGGEIHLTLEASGREAAIRVRDNGVGIAPEMLPRVFELFVQADRSTAGGQVGLGIGLTMVRSLVQMHGGRVEARSDGPGKGSEFVIWLPLAEGAARNEEKPKEAPRVRRRVLVVDDNTDTAEMLTLLLKKDGHEVVTAYNGPEALDLARDFRPEVVLLDVSMPGMDGFEVARRMRQDPKLKGVSLLAVTGYGLEEDRERTRNAGFDSHLVKPVQNQVLAEAIQAAGAR